MTTALQTLTTHFADVPDPRVARTQEHALLDILLIAICGSICGANDWVAIEEFGKAKEAWLRTFLALPNGIPSHDTFGRVFARLDPVAFQARFLRWTQAVAGVLDSQVVALDGKVSRRSHDRGAGKEALRLVSAWATEHGLVIGQRAVAEGTNEISTLPDLLKLLALEGCIVTIDAIGCQTAIAQTIRDQQADYVLSVKENQPSLHAKLTRLFSAASQGSLKPYSHDYHRAVDKGHGRLEIRDVWTVSDPQWLAYLDPDHAWPALGCVGMVLSERRVADKTSITARYFISSLPGEAKTLGRAVRAHWHIENSLHWVLDISFREDDSRVRVGQGPANLAVLRHMALNLLQRETSCRRGIQVKRLKAAWDTDYLHKVLSA